MKEGKQRGEINPKGKGNLDEESKSLIPPVFISEDSSCKRYIEDTLNLVNRKPRVQMEEFQK